MHVEATDRYIDDSGDPVEELNLVGSRFDRVAVKRTDDGVDVRATEVGSNNVTSLSATLTEELFKGVAVDSGERRRDVDDDLLDALLSVGYCVVDS